VRIATGWRARDRVLAEQAFFCSPQLPDRLWGPPSLLSSEYRGLFLSGLRRLECEAGQSIYLIIVSAPAAYLTCIHPSIATLHSQRQTQSSSYLTTESLSVRLSWCQTTIRARDQFLFLLEIFLRQLGVCYFMAPSLAKRRVCNLIAAWRHARNRIIVPIFYSLPT
jgi:hypothetical protein